jgi:GTP-binding protein
VVLYVLFAESHALFVDRVTLIVQGGDGGNGCVSFRREKYVPRGGPNGGDGGRGGSVVLRTLDGLTNLAHLSSQRHWTGERGEHGQGSDCTGRDGKDRVIDVPPGTIVRDAERDFVIRDLTEPGAELVVARGGKGGLGNAYFKSATNRAPRTAERGQPGEARTVILELKTIADVGLVGLPNAGKSTLLSRISRATPDIANYPFTTKYPNLGVVVLDHARAFIVADIPGLIEGAHAGAGLGHEFLRHVDRTRLLLHLVDGAPIDGSDPLENYRVIRHELETYSPDLARRQEIVVVTKLDIPAAALTRDRFEIACPGPVLGISAVTGKGLPELLREVGRTLDRLPVDATRPAAADSDVTLPRT